MKVSLHWAKYYSNVDSTKVGVKKLVQKIGAQLGAVDEVVEWGPRFDGVVVAKIITCDKHPNADKLNVCTIDDGGVNKKVKRNDDGHVVVVCGAPNATTGLTVAWIQPGATVPSTHDKDPFVLESREIRGVVSNGMLASPKELGLGDTHDGILEIDAKDVGEDNTKPGTPFKNLYGCDDVVVDIENKMFTHRPDLFGVLGVARELAGIQGFHFQSPEWYTQEPTFESVDELPLEVNVEVPDLVPRFMAVAMKDIEIKPSPMWMQAGLTRVGIRPINNIVDMTNYVMYLTGQPLHAYDYDKVKDRSGKVPTLVARKARKGETVALLNGKTIDLDDPAIVIATDKEVVGVGGVMGGADTEVDENTKSIIIEAATFDMYSIRRTSMKYGLFTDAVTRFNKGQSPLQNDRAIVYAMKLVDESCDGKQASPVIDAKVEVPDYNHVNVATAFVNERLGLKLSRDEMIELLENVEFQQHTIGIDEVCFTAPFWRTDIEIPEDIVEEVGRLYGYDHIPLELPKHTITPAVRNAVMDRKSKVSDILSAAGANEVLTYTFVHGDVLKKVGQDESKAFKLSNALSPELQFYRLSLTPSLLEKVQPNLKSDMVRSDDNELAIFEINKIHMIGQQDKVEPELPAEGLHVALVFTADDKTASRKYAGAAYYQARVYLEQILPNVQTDLMSLDEFDLSSDPWGMQMCAPYEPKRSAVIVRDNMIWGVVGEYRAAVRKALKLPDFTAGFEVSLDILEDLDTHDYVPLPKFPKVQQDISLKIPADTQYRDVFELIRSEIETNKPDDTIAVLRPVDIYKADESSKHMTYRLWLSAYNRTLKAEEVNRLLDDTAKVAKDKLGAERI